MNQAQHSPQSDLHHWMLWVNPEHAQLTSLKEWPESLKSRVLTMRPRNATLACRAIVTAIESGFYAMITLPTQFFCELDEWKIKQSALSHNTMLVWK